MDKKFLQEYIREIVPQLAFKVTLAKFESVPAFEAFQYVKNVVYENSKRASNIKYQDLYDEPSYRCNSTYTYLMLLLKYLPIELTDLFFSYLQNLAFDSRYPTFRYILANRVERFPETMKDMSYFHTEMFMDLIYHIQADFVNEYMPKMKSEIENYEKERKEQEDILRAIPKTKLKGDTTDENHIATFIINAPMYREVCDMLDILIFGYTTAKTYNERTMILKILNEMRHDNFLDGTK